MFFALTVVVFLCGQDPEMRGRASGVLYNIVWGTQLTGKYDVEQGYLFRSQSCPIVKYEAE